MSALGSVAGIPSPFASSRHERGPASANLGPKYAALGSPVRTGASLEYASPALVSRWLPGVGSIRRRATPSQLTTAAPSRSAQTTRNGADRARVAGSPRQARVAAIPPDAA